MTFFEMTRPEEMKPNFLDGLVQRIFDGLFSMQYTRMVGALNNLTDEQLDQIGVKRNDIPEYARQCLR